MPCVRHSSHRKRDKPREATFRKAPQSLNDKIKGLYKISFKADALERSLMYAAWGGALIGA
jgi:hypothetical protein